MAAIDRLVAVADVSSLAAELGLDRGLLYKWARAFRSGGVAGLRLPGEHAARRVPGPGGPGASEAGRSGLSEVPAVGGSVAALERKVAQQALELDFFRAALQHFAGRRRPGGGSGGTGSTR